jgi:dolichol-phosphate mannosyltransferase
MFGRLTGSIGGLPVVQRCVKSRHARTAGAVANGTGLPARREADGRPRLSVVIPARAEGDLIGGVLDRLLDVIRMSYEVLVVVDNSGDETLAVVEAWAQKQPQVACLVSGNGPGQANAIRDGMQAASGGVIVVLMADGSDDPAQVDTLARLVERGVAVAAASRYMPGGQQVGGKFVKRALSRLAGRSLQWLARPGTCDATHSFKAYSAAFVAAVGIESRRGFEIGIELTAKARRLRLPVAELPTIWLDRSGGQSGFRLIPWLPAYARWYAFCFGRRLSPGALGERAAGRRR